jgi:hypothetical protein
MDSSRARSSEASRISAAAVFGKAAAQVGFEFSTSSGSPSSRRRRWPMGYSTVSSSTVPSFSSTRSELAIERFSGS